MESELRALMPHKVKVAPYQSQDKWGESTFGADMEYAALIEQKARQVRATSGEERVSMTTLYLDTPATITPRDRVTLPAGFVPSQPPIISVARFSDELGLHHIVLYC